MTDLKLTTDPIARIAAGNELDKPELPVWAIRRAMQEAYELGRLDQYQRMR